MKVRYTRGALKIVSAPTGPILSSVPNTNIFEAFEAKLKNMIGPGTSIPIRSGSSIHIKSTSLLAPPGQCLSYITFLSEGGMVLTRHYPSIKSQPHVFPFYRSNPSGNSRGMRIYPGEKGTTSGRCCSASWCKVTL